MDEQRCFAVRAAVAGCSGTPAPSSAWDSSSAADMILGHRGACNGVHQRVAVRRESRSPDTRRFDRRRGRRSISSVVSHSQQAVSRGYAGSTPVRARQAVNAIEMASANQKRRRRGRHLEVELRRLNFQIKKARHLVILVRDYAGYRSSFRIVPNPCASKSVAPSGEDRFTRKVSSCSRVRSPLTATVTVFVRSPGAKTRVPAVAA